MEAEKQIKEESVDQPEKKEEDKRFVMVGEPVEKKGELIERPRYSGFLTLPVKEHLSKYGGELSLVESGQVPKETKVLMVTSYGAADNIRCTSVPVTLPTRGQVLIKSVAWGLNYQDLLTRHGYLEHAPRTPFILGSEVAGEIVGLGDKVNEFKVGDRVVALPEFGALSEYVTCRASVCFKMAADMSWHEAIALATNGITAYSLLFELGTLHPGKSILLHPAPGGLGTLIKQMAHTVDNVTLFVVDMPGRRRFQPVEEQVEPNEDQDFYIEHGVDYVSEIRRVAPMGVDLVLDSRCGDNFHKDYNLLRPTGKYIIYGSHAAAVGENRSFLGAAKAWWGMEKISPLKLWEDNKSVCGFNLNRLLHYQRDRTHLKRVMHYVFRMWFDGKVKPIVDSVFACDDFNEALHRLEEHNDLGKIIIDPTFEKDSEKALEAKANIFERCVSCAKPACCPDVEE